MTTFKQYVENDDWGDFFNDKTTVVKRTPDQVKNFTLKLYRGFNPQTVRKLGDSYVLNPERSEQGILWFTHDYISEYDPIEYAIGHGEWFLTYPLQCKKHFYVAHWSDGTTTEGVPEEIQKMSEPTENCRFYAGIELPNGWVFTYKNEKFIGCCHELQVTRDMIKNSDEF